MLLLGERDVEKRSLVVPLPCPELLLASLEQPCVALADRHLRRLNGVDGGVQGCERRCCGGDRGFRCGHGLIRLGEFGARARRAPIGEVHGVTVGKLA